MSKFIHNSRHAGVLASGAPLAPFQEVELDSEAVKHPHNQTLIDEGVLHPILAKKPSAKSAPVKKEGNDE